MTEFQMNLMAHKCECAAIAFAKENGFSGLSESGRFSFYAAIQDAIKDEWLRAKEGRDCPKVSVEEVRAALKNEPLRKVPPYHEWKHRKDGWCCIWCGLILVQKDHPGPEADLNYITKEHG
jgi:hypothetical protein